MAKKNAQLHIVIETARYNKLKQEAKDKNLSLGELCRRRLRNKSSLERLEKKIDRILKKMV